jgi:hypothetical protein
LAGVEWTNERVEIGVTILTKEFILSTGYFGNRKKAILPVQWG